MCCPTHCASYCAPCQPLLRAFSGWIRSPPPTVGINQYLCSDEAVFGIDEDMSVGIDKGHSSRRGRLVLCKVWMLIHIKVRTGYALYQQMSVCWYQSRFLTTQGSLGIHKCLSDDTNQGLSTYRVRSMLINVFLLFSIKVSHRTSFAWCQHVSVCCN